MTPLIDGDWRSISGYEEKFSQAELAKNFGVTNHAIHRIKAGKNWDWLTGLGKEGILDATTD